MIKTVIFDLDGTLVNTIGGIANSCNHVLTTYGYKPHLTKDYEQFVGNGLAKTIFKALPENVRNNDENFKTNTTTKEYSTVDNTFLQPYLDLLLKHYFDHPLVETFLYEGINELLDDLEERGITWGIHTNKAKPIGQKIANAFFGNRDYLGLAGPNEHTLAKPSPEGSYQLLGKNFKKEEVLFVGDTEVDIATAKALDVPCVSVTWGFRRKAFLKEQKPDYCIDQVKALIQVIDSFK